MKFYNLILISILIGSISASANIDKLLFQEFTNWASKYDKNYPSDIVFNAKLKIYVENRKVVNSLNIAYANKTQFELNAFADMTQDDFKSKVLMRNKLNVTDSSNRNHLIKNDNKSINLPESFDWRVKGAVTPVKDQGSVGTCWAFSAVQNLEGLYFLKGNKLTNLSIEQVVDCDGSINVANLNSDCGVYGGWPYLAMEYVKRAGGIAAEVDYPYCSGIGKDNCFPCGPPGYNATRCGPAIPYCKVKDSCQAKVDPSRFVPNLTVKDWIQISEDETEIASNLTTIGPLSIALNAELLQFYRKGIFDPIFCNPKNLDHGVLIVGFGVENDHPYWIVKNSWGEKWGESGYFRIARGKGKCGVNTSVVSAILN